MEDGKKTAWLTTVAGGETATVLANADKDTHTVNCTH